MNWKNEKRYKEEGYECIDCLALSPPVHHPDHQDILMTPECQGNSDLRQGRVMSNEKHQAHFLMELFLRRKSRESMTT